MTARGTALLLAVLAALLAYLWLAELRPWSAASAPEEAPLLALAPGAVARVELTGAGERLTAALRDGAWVDEHGRPWHDGVVPGLLETLTTLGPVMVVDPAPRRPEAYGLGAGATRLSLATRDGGPALALEIGAPNPAGTGLYVRRADRPHVLLLGGVLRWELDKLRDAAPRPSP
jgi:hypothetical protein